jgi:hypothetical protein
LACACIWAADGPAPYGACGGVVGDEDFAVAFETGAGLLRISLTGTEMSYAFPDGYLYNGMDCDNVIYHGTLTH